MKKVFLNLPSMKLSLGKTMKVTALAALLTVGLCGTSFAQTYKPGKLQLKLAPGTVLLPTKLTSQGTALPIDLKGILNVTKNNLLNNLFQQHKVLSIRQKMPFAKTPELRMLYEVICDCDQTKLQQAIDAQHLTEVQSTEQVPIPILAYEPTDYMYYLASHCSETNSTDPCWQWYLPRVQANKAWDITKGNPQLRVAIVDTKFDGTHPDLQDKLYPPYDPYNRAPFPAFAANPTNNHRDHGCMTASVLAAKTDGGGQLASIGFNTRLMAYSMDEDGDGLEEAVHASTVMQARIISISWFNKCSSTSSDIAAVKEILDNGTAVFAAAGNGTKHCGGQDVFPFSRINDDRIVIVGATQQGDIAVPDFSHYANIDLCAPGWPLDVATCTLNDDGSKKDWPYYGFSGGTSNATPMVAGVAALMLTVRPCLTVEQVKYILKNTVDPIADAANYVDGNGNSLVGTGRVNAWEAVKFAQNWPPFVISTGGMPDLYTKDDDDDTGSEPYVNTKGNGHPESNDIWVRIKDDGDDPAHPENQVNSPTAPDYSSSQPNWVYVRVRNRGQQVSKGTETMNLYWMVSGTIGVWPDAWGGELADGSPGKPAYRYIHSGTSTPDPNLVSGNFIGSVPIPAGINPGGEAIVKMPWYPPNPDQFELGLGTKGLPVCIMSRIKTTTTPPYGIIYEESPGYYYGNMMNNNRISVRNVTVVNTPINGLKIVRKRVMVGEPLVASAIRLSFREMGSETGSEFVDNGTVTIDLDKQLYDKWVAGGKKGTGVSSAGIIKQTVGGVVKSLPITLMDNVTPYTVAVTGKNASLENLHFNAGEVQGVNMQFSYHAQAPGDTKKLFKYDVTQTGADGKIQGMNLYEITHPDCVVPDAGADKTICRVCNTTLTASPVTPGAEYTWYNSKTNAVVGRGSSVNVTPLVTTNYLLKASSPNGCTDFDEVTVTVDNSLPILPDVNRCFSGLQVFPNPTGGNILSVKLNSVSATNITMVLAQATNAALKTVNVSAVPGDNNFPIDISSIPSGVYKLIITCTNGVGSQTVTVTKQ